MKTAYSLLTLLSVSLVAAGPLPGKRNNGIAVVRSAFAPAPASVIAREASNDDDAEDLKAAINKAGSLFWPTKLTLLLIKPSCGAQGAGS